MQTLEETRVQQDIAQQAIHQLVLPGFIAAAQAGYTAKQMLVYLANAKEGLAVCAAFGLAGQDLAATLSGELTT